MQATDADRRQSMRENANQTDQGSVTQKAIAS